MLQFALRSSFSYWTAAKNYWTANCKVGRSSPRMIRIISNGIKIICFSVYRYCWKKSLHRNFHNVNYFFTLKISVEWTDWTVTWWESNYSTFSSTTLLAQTFQEWSSPECPVDFLGHVLNAPRNDFVDEWSDHATSH